MKRNLKSRKILILIVFLIAAVALYSPLADLLFATRLLLAIRVVASGSMAPNLAIKESKVQRVLDQRNLEALLYQPASTRPRAAVLIVPGLSELGCYHPRLIALSRTLADKGFLVLTPDIEMFRRFQVAPEAVDEISFWYFRTRELAGAEQVRSVGLAGISFSATLALMTAASPPVRDSVTFVLGIGAYQDLLRCSRQWFAPGARTVSEGYYPVRFYAKWIIMLAALDMLSAVRDREVLRQVLLNLLLQRPPPAAPPELSTTGQRWYRLAVMAEDESDPELTLAIENYLTPRLYSWLSPGEAAAEVRCPVFLVHGAYDDLIPPEESAQLQKQIKQAKNYVLISPFLTHTHPLEKSLSLKQKTAAVFDMLTFFYRLVRVIR